MNVNTTLWLPQPSTSLYAVQPEAQTEETSKEKQPRLEGKKGRRKENSNAMLVENITDSQRRTMQ